MNLINPPKWMTTRPWLLFLIAAFSLVFAVFMLLGLNLSLVGLFDLILGILLFSISANLFYLGVKTSRSK